MKIIMEIRAGEGGEDAKLLVPELGTMYLKMAARANVAAEITATSVG